MSNFTSFLKNNYNTTFNTRRSGKGNDVTNINFCIVNNINPYLGAPIKDFELVMPEGCYSLLSNKLSTQTVSSCISLYMIENLPKEVLSNIVECINPTTTTTTTSRI